MLLQLVISKDVTLMVQDRIILVDFVCLYCFMVVTFPVLKFAMLRAADSTVDHGGEPTPRNIT